EESSLPLDMDRIYLVDSGGQYADGTTDVTRTIIVGTPTDEMRDRFTRVLKGHIALATAIFPKETRGSQLDGFARQYLWQAGLDYGHGTGHGVGSYLGVHEGPQRISAANYPGTGWDEPLKAGMILSNEPGYYKGGDYGIRIENLVVVGEREIEGGEATMLGFETLTFAPIDRNLIKLDLLTRAERAWVDGYHHDVVARIGPQLDEATAAWLGEVCAPLG
ncbi:MAG: M24 family metallopeptidase, partial [Sphingomonadales bacterium]|nr:M24 family metallopeptidase [Sphingomonadales bacterium]